MDDQQSVEYVNEWFVALTYTVHFIKFDALQSFDASCFIVSTNSLEILGDAQSAHSYQRRLKSVNVCHRCFAITSITRA